MLPPQEQALKKYRQSPTGLLVVHPTGSGKTRLALNATRGRKTSVVGTASLKKNFEQEEQKAFGTKSSRTTSTFAAISRGNKLPGGDALVIDESQYIRNPETKAFSNILKQRQKYRKALLLSATPMYNEASDLATQVNLAANKPLVPMDKERFNKMFFEDKKVSVPFFARITGVKPGDVKQLKNRAYLKNVVKPYVHVAKTQQFKGLIPHSSREIVSVEMGPRQAKLYKYLNKQIPRSVRYKIEKNLPPSKQERPSLNAFMSGLRQVSNTTAPYVKNPAKAESTKLDKVVKDMTEELARGGKVLAYSNYIGAGIEPLSRRLKALGIKHSVLTGEMSGPNRLDQIKQYNSGKVKAFLYSGAGSEGLNLPKTSLVQLVEPHWNKSRLDQAAARGIRRGDDPSKTVKVKTYVSTLPKSFFSGHAPVSSGQYLMSMSRRKQDEINQVLEALR